MHGKEKYDYSPPLISNMRIEKQDDDIIFTLNDKEVYKQLNNTLLDNTRIGLYSQKNEDAVYQELTFLFMNNSLTSIADSYSEKPLQPQQ